jgi:hypothetical protein
MWVFFKEGYVSIVKHRTEKDVLLVRARRAEIISDFFGKDMLSEIKYDAGADYKCRVFVHKNDVAKAVSDKALGINYTSYKSAITDRRLKYAALEVWQVLWEAYQ